MNFAGDKKIQKKLIRGLRYNMSFNMRAFYFICKNEGNIIPRVKWCPFIFVDQYLPSYSLYKILHIAPHFYKCAHAKRPEISIFGKVRRLSMVFPHFLGGKIE